MSARKQSIRIEEDDIEALARSGKISSRVRDEAMMTRDELSETLLDHATSRNYEGHDAEQEVEEHDVVQRMKKTTPKALTKTPTKSKETKTGAPTRSDKPKTLPPPPSEKTPRSTKKAPEPTIEASQSEDLVLNNMIEEPTREVHGEQQDDLIQDEQMHDEQAQEDSVQDEQISSTQHEQYTPTQFSQNPEMTQADALEETQTRPQKKTSAKKETKATKKSAPKGGITKKSATGKGTRTKQAAMTEDTKKIAKFKKGRDYKTIANTLSIHKKMKYCIRSFDENLGVTKSAAVLISMLVHKLSLEYCETVGEQMLVNGKYKKSSVVTRQMAENCFKQFLKNDREIRNVFRLAQFSTKEINN